MTSDIFNWVELMRCRSDRHPDRRALVFLKDHGNEESHLTYGGLDVRARRIAAGLQSQGIAKGDRVLLLYPAGLDFTAAFFGCLYAGAIAIPAPAPRLGRNLRLLRGIIDDAAPRAVLGTGPTLAGVEPLTRGETGAATIPCWITNDALLDGNPEDWREPEIGEKTLAFLQYTSGSTARPKGVMVSHANLLYNHRMICSAFDQSERTKIVSWLPHFHDMGLIGNILQALFLGSECALMPPEAFLMKPARWLQAISKYDACQSGAPNFAYDLCVRRVTAEQRAELDLSRWELAFIGSEPVRSHTLERFARAFAPCGFRREAFYPCYGLAEATLFVSGGRKSTGFDAVDFDAESLQNHRASAPANGKGRTLVACGNGWLDQEIAIVDPHARTPCRAGAIGEIWVSGKNVTQGYWNRPEETKCAFHAELACGATGGFLRTGDLGFSHEGNLFIAGRIKDHIIIAGRNHHPCDIEHTVEKCHPGIRAGGCAAFAVDTGDEERLVVLAELDRSCHAGDNKTVELAIRRAVAEEHDVTAHTITLLKPAGCPRTSSGKVMRHACRTEFLAGTLNAWGPHS